MSSLHRLAALGQSVWIDALPTNLDQLVRDHAVTGVTTNPTILAAAGPVDVIAAARAACDRLAGVYRTSDGVDGFVSLEVDPALAHNAGTTVEAALRLRAHVDRPNLYVKIPATAAGVEAVEEATALGIPVNATLIFGLARHRQIAEAYLRGRARGGTAPSVASFFVSRVDVETDARLRAIGADPSLQGRLAIANAKLAYRQARDLFATEPTPQRCLWASTSTKAPNQRDVRYVEALIGPDTVTTLPPITLHAFADHGIAAPTLDRGYDEAEQAFSAIAAAGIDYDDVISTLEADGLRRFAEAWSQQLAAA